MLAVTTITDPNPNTAIHGTAKPHTTDTKYDRVILGTVNNEHPA